MSPRKRTIDDLDDVDDEDGMVEEELDEESDLSLEIRDTLDDDELDEGQDEDDLDEVGEDLEEER